MIEFINVTKTYDKNEKDALKNVNLFIDKGEFVFLVGRSGAGKSTFIKLLLREIDASTGTVKIKGHDISKLSKKEIPYLRRKLGVVFQDFRLLENKSVYENVAYAMEIIGRPERKIRKRCRWHWKWSGFHIGQTIIPMSSPAGNSSVLLSPEPLLTTQVF